jgi:prepilin-type N-terminal cleavage/methylation domain-containing protein
MHTTSRPPRNPQPRGGFTLIELLTVIAILSILIAFLVPAVLNARRSALVVQVTTDITTLDNAIKSFKNEFGVEPPSTITLCEAAADWNSTAANIVTSRAIISRIWPQFDFSINRNLNDDVNSSGVDNMTSTFTLTGSECLVFFLGGVVIWNDTNGDGERNKGDAWIPSGFSRNPADPFSRTGTNRVPPFINFLSNRLIMNSSFFIEPAPSMRPYTQANIYPISGYSDPISGTPARYLYVSSNDGQGYLTADLGGVMTDAYRNGTSANSPYWNPNGYQIISAGFDRKFGTGGAWQKGESLPSSRDAERDNITNFSNGLLEP